MPVENLIEVRLESIRFAAREINLFEFRRTDQRELPGFTPGAHVDLHLPDGNSRQYSMVGDGLAPQTYVIGVKRESGGRGGSRFLHDAVRVGAVLQIGAPRNNFPLVEDAAHSVLIAGGIGVTPIFAMWRRLKALGRPVELYYSTRSREEAAFLEALRGDPAVSLHFDDEADSLLDLAPILRRSPEQAHFYCCGPVAMLEAFRSVASARPSTNVHTESFAPVADGPKGSDFIVELARSGLNVQVSAGQTILAALRNAGVDVPSSCEQGVCGACITDVIDGTPDHLDTVLTEQERSEGKKITVCCSGSRSPRLVLDL